LGVTVILKVYFNKPSKSNKLIYNDTGIVLWRLAYIFVMNADNMT